MAIQGIFTPTLTGPPPVREVPAGDDIVAFVRHQAAVRPGHPAVVDGEQVLTYRELVERAGRIAGRLIELGVRPDHVVGLHLPRGTDLVVAALATAMSGGAYLALDTEHPEAWSRRLLARSGARVVIASGEDAERVREAHLTLLDPRDDLPPAAKPPPAVAPGAGAYVAYTSGTTGEPRGVLVEHPGLANLVRWYAAEYDVTPADHLTQLARPSFDAFALEVWPCLALGATLHIVPQRLVAVPAELVSWLCASGVTVAFVPTPLAVELFAVPWPAGPPELRLRTMLVGGDRLAGRPPRSLPFRVVNNYGPTEATVVATCGEVLADGPPGEPPSIGEPLPGVLARIVDDAGRTVDTGMPGELVLGGVGVARGYIGERTTGGAVTVEQPFTDSFGARSYRTGDLVRRSADGHLHYLGRCDDQVKLNGIRVSPREVEAALERQPGVRAAAVVVHHTPQDNTAVLVGYVAVDPSYVPATVRDRLAGQLPAVLVPALVLEVDALPTTAHGKIDRAALAARPLPVTAGDSPFRTPAQRLLGELWTEVLGTSAFDLDSHFFDVGGDSLRVLRLVNKAKLRSFRLLPDDVYQYPVFRDLAAALEDAATTAEPARTGEDR